MSSAVTRAGAVLAALEDHQVKTADKLAASVGVSPRTIYRYMRDLRAADSVVEAYPAAISRGDLADKMGLSRTASTLGVYLGKVSRLGFVETLPGSMVRAADFMFEGRK